MRIEYNTNTINNRNQFDYWHDAICDTYMHLDCTSEQRSKFRGKIRLERLNALTMSFISANAQTINRRSVEISKSTEAFFLLSLQLSSCGVIEQQGRRAKLTPNDFVLYSSISPFNFAFENSFEQLVIQIPRSDLLSRLPNADELTGQRVNGSNGLGRMIASHLLELSKSIHAQDEVVQRFMQENLIDLVATGLSSIQGGRLELSNPELLLLQRAKSFTLANLWNPYLDRKMVANSTGVSVRHLSSIFAKNSSSIATYIRNSRLDKIANELSDVRFIRQSISEIAMKWGMNNLQHFSKIFKDKFGVSPREYRKHNSIG